MNIKLNNVGAIKEADVILDGLTIIAGENDTGKSTVGKMMFAIVKALSRYEEDLIGTKEYKITQLVEKLFFLIRRNYDFKENPILRLEFHPNTFIKQLRPFITSPTGQQSHLSFPDEVAIDKDVLPEILIKKMSIIKKATPINEDTSKLGDIYYLIEQIQLALLEENDIHKSILSALNRALISEFHFEISPKTATNITKISLKESTNKLLDILISNNQIDNFQLHDEILPFEDITFIETPIILQMHAIIDYAETLLEKFTPNTSIESNGTNKPKIALHIKDLMTKLEAARFFFPIFHEANSPRIHFLKKINKAINGEYYYDDKHKDFFFRKEYYPNGSKAHSFPAEFRASNTASGIKAFGIIQLLLQAEIINDRSLLIIDEPETHLHPKWQVEYARLITELVKNDIAVLITSHSPYMIQALKVFSEQNGIQDRTNYYLAEKEENGLFANINNVNNNLNKLFTKLSQPLQQLVWTQKLVLL